jgi:prolyl-tRNA synthetase
MKASQLFTKTSKTTPGDETSKNAILLIQAGYISKEMAGVYAYLPLGKMVLDNIVQIIREEMNAQGGNEINMTALQNKDVWEASGRWDDAVMDVWFRTTLANGTVLGLAPTHEEPLTQLMKRFINSYKDLPAYPYQFQVKFRNELRSKSGLMRGREFLMKDLYSFSRDQTEHEVFYEKMSQAYLRIYNRLGLGAITYKTFASGGSFSKFSHEFQTLSDVGEDTVYVHEGKKLAINNEVYNDEVLAELGVTKDELVERRAVEVGNIFTLGTKYSDALHLLFADEDGKQKPVYMGSYGIGPSRLMGLIAEHFADEKGLVWPKQIAPFTVYLAVLGDNNHVVESANALYSELTSQGVGVLYDDRDVRPGEKFADADLMGIPYRVVVSDKTVAVSSYEVKKRTENEAELMNQDQLLKMLQS